MPTVQDVLDAIEQLAPSRFAFSFDRIGLQVGDPTARVDKVAVSLDPCLEAARFARENGAQILVSHHPVIWDPLPSLRLDSYKGRVLNELVSGGVAFAAAHTNWDCAPGGINDVLAGLLGLQDVRSAGSPSDKEVFKVVVTAPPKDADKLIDAMSKAGAGRIGLYERCAFLGDGTGTFRALPGADPTVGTTGEIENVPERRIELVCPGERLDAVVAAMVAAHSYEQPAYDLFPVKASGGQAISRIGILPKPMSTEAFRLHLDSALSTRTLIAGPDKTINTVAVCGGAAADEWRQDADAFVTGEVPHHVMVEASEIGMVIAAAGHFATENPGAMRLGELIQQESGIQLLKFEPRPGQCGRPL